MPTQPSTAAGLSGRLPVTRALTTVAIRFEHDVVLARQRARQIATLLGFDNHEQVRIATAVSEIARNVFRYARPGRAEFVVTDSAPPLFQIRITDNGPGIRDLDRILDGQYVSQTGMGMGIVGARRLMDEFEIDSGPQGTTVLMGKSLGRRAPAIGEQALAKIADQLVQQPPQNPFEELQRQNQELLATLAEVQRQKTELSELNKELEDTNRGVVALYAELDERADYLRRASELKTQFLSNMTHEFRTPLNSILSLSRILLDRVDGPLSEEQERQVKFIQKGANDLSELVNDLLDLAKVEAGKVAIRPNEFLVQDLFGALRGMLRPLLAHNSAVSLIFEEPEGIPPLNSDESKVSQVLRNLISNALKYTERGEVRVSARFSEPGKVEFAVADTGIGIAAADQETVFEEFTQVEGPHQKGKRGTGLGLPLSRKLAGLLGGTLTVSSEPGVGSTFTLRVPIQYKGPEVVTFVPELSTELDPNRQPLLIVEDNRETLFVYEKYLKGTGFQPIPARTIRQAREALQRFRPVAVILDVLLSRESTWSFLADLKQSAGTRDIPVLVITMLENQHKAFALGADTFHTKPVDRQWLLDQLGKFVPQTNPQLVLIIDDDEASRYVLAGLLADTKFRRIQAENGQTGLDLARERKPVAIFLDLKMPDFNGFKVLDALKSDPATSAIPVIVHTSKLLTATDRKKLEGRVVAIIPKDHSDREASARAIQEALAKALQTTKTPASN